VVISDGVKDTPGVYTFQGMKGLNGLEDRNIYIILTWMAPEKYAELNVLGQWLGNENILLDYCQDQINQAVGRNREAYPAVPGSSTCSEVTDLIW
jgi:hypothetical protein